jgi:hypothetical protein
MRSDHKATLSLAICPIREGGGGGVSSRLPKAKYPLNRFLAQLFCASCLENP